MKPSLKDSVKKIQTAKLPERGMTASALIALGAQHLSESKRLLELKSSNRNLRGDRAFEECEETVQRQEIDIMLAQRADDLYLAAPDLFRACEKALALIEALMPGLAKIAVKDYAAVNATPIEIRRALKKAGAR